MARVEPEELYRPFRKPQTDQRGCDAEGCAEEGLYRAPVSRHQLNQYYWFCLDHVRDYNRAWNYFSGLTPEEVEMLVREDTVALPPLGQDPPPRRQWRGQGRRGTAERHQSGLCDAKSGLFLSRLPAIS
ncbi:MAG: hypothetical protein P8X52_10985 [Limibacillus sp.]